ncbi:peptidoglycan bridge formation glycyltransferase FemA/FemB family protein, partial [Candidatus Roizmanbacteria bacterium]|nr:peptidoglycan bridge formation glycyltransferase FemA/FemB family protein [Candidatus Roizmanbacteria bacterium]
KFQISNKSIITKLLNYLTTLAMELNCSFIRIAPILENTSKNQKIFSDLGFKKAPIYMHAERVWILPLNKSEDQLLSEMRKTTRYLIRKAERDGVAIEKRTNEKAVKNFYQIYLETAKRENFVAFSKEFIRQEFESFNKTRNAVFFEAVHLKGVLASALIIFTKSTAFYHQGASIHSKIPATYLLQWEAIKEAKKRGCKFYNFWGTLQEGRTPKSWSGLTLFKQGFGGYQVDYLPTQDLILSPKYYLTYFYEKFLAWRRGV